MSKIVGRKGHVFSFEPMNYSFNILTHLCSSSNYNNISLFNVAIGDKHEMVGMNVQYLPEKHSAIFDTNTASHISFDCKCKETLCIPIDSIDLPVKINLAKIDVEGY